MSPTPVLDDEDLAAIDDRLASMRPGRAPIRHQRSRPGQPVHTVYIRRTGSSIRIPARVWSN